jgi:hypothetical protein
MAETTDTREGIEIICGDTESLSPEKLDAFMQDFDREATLGKVATDPKYWDQRITYAQDRLRLAQVARKSVAVIASDAATFIEQQPGKFAELPEEQRAVLSELASRITVIVEE